MDHSIHYGFSSLLVIIFVTFSFGFGIPILFPVASLAIGVLYRVEKFSMYYIYKQPPMYDKEMTQNIVQSMRLAPVFYLMCGYWMITNQQLISNDHLHPMYSKEDTPETDHNLGLIFSAAGWVAPYWPLGVMAGICFLFYFSIDYINEKLDLKDIGSNLWELEEGLSNYWAALSKIDKRWIEKEELYRRQALDMPMMTDEQMQRIQNPQFKRMQHSALRLHNTHTYDILANPHYVNHFQYISASIGKSKRGAMIIDSDTDEENNAVQSDLVRICLNLSFLPEHKGKAF